MEVRERIRRGYLAVGPGAHRDVLAMFDQVGDEPAAWVVHDAIESGRDHPTRDVVAMDLFAGIPAHWEVIGVDLRMWRLYDRRQRLVVGGRFRTRPRGSWDVMAVPFVHIWCFAGGRVVRVIDYLAGVELRRLAPAA